MGRFEFFQKFAKIFAAHGASPVENQKIFNHEVLIILLGDVFEVELTYRYIFAFKFTLRSHQPDIVPIICHQDDGEGGGEERLCAGPTGILLRRAATTIYRTPCCAG